ncbi:MAG: BON domain-containing protein [Kofleriaceae bacterium]
MSREPAGSSPEIRLPADDLAAHPERSYDELARRLVPDIAALDLPLGAPDPNPDPALIAAALASLGEVDTTAVTVTVADGVATMTGAVAHGDDRDRVASAVSAVPGVVRVVDHLDLRAVRPGR